MSILKFSLISLILILPVLSSAQTITGTSSDFVSVATEEPYTTTIALYGTDLDYLLFNPVTIQLGPLTGTVLSGNETGVNISFTIDSTLLLEREASYPITVLNGETLITSSPALAIFNPFVGDYIYQQPNHYLNHISQPHKRTKQTIGLNVHQTLGGDSTLDGVYAQRLDDSKTIWVREHISYAEVMGSDSAAWLKRYDKIMLQYRDHNQKVIAMLAYGDGNDAYAEPARWEEFVRLMVKRYRNYVDVWEIWNEPDSAAYLSPQHNWRTYRHILKTGSALVRQYDPDAIVLPGAVSNLSNPEFTKQLYGKGKKYFDDFNIHVYYCTKPEQLAGDFDRLRKVVARYRSPERIWVTELGCSTGGTGITKKQVKQYLQTTTKQLLAENFIGPILLYSFRDRTYLTSDPYEAYFGLMTDALVPKPAWRWYKLLVR
ncbi:MAG: glycosyl hydrolase [Patescibacteria group bacterium]|jgi:hypothetical protein